jgi:hypothetical protein
MQWSWRCRLLALRVFGRELVNFVTVVRSRGRSELRQRCGIAKFRPSGRQFGGLNHHLVKVVNVWSSLAMSCLECPRIQIAFSEAIVFVVALFRVVGGGGQRLAKRTAVCACSKAKSKLKSKVVSSGGSEQRLAMRLSANKVAKDQLQKPN